MASGEATTEGRYGWATLEDGSRVPLTAEECDGIWAAVEAQRVRRQTAMPDEQSAIRALQDAVERLKDFGWRDWVYCPKDGSSFDVLELGSTGIHRGYYHGEWPTGVVVTGEGLDCGPSRHVILHRLDPEAEAARKAKMAAAAAQFRAEMEAENGKR